MSKETVLSELTAKVGQEVHVGEWLTVEQSRIDQFAEATGDHQWIHVDKKRSQSDSPYGDTIAHGFLTLSLLPRLTREGSGDEPRYPGVKLGVNYGLNRVRFPAPVLVNSRVRARSVLKSVEEVSGCLQMIREVTIEVEGGDKPCCVAESISRMYF